MKFKDALVSNDTIEAVIGEDKGANLIEVEIQGDRSEMVYLDKETAFKLGQQLIILCWKLEGGKE